MSKRIVYGMIVGLLVLSLGTSSVAAHRTVYSPDNKIRFTYGHLDEPIVTYQKTGLDLTVRDNATGGVISGLEFVAGQPAKLNVKYRYGAEGGQTLDITEKFAAQHNQPGKYTYPIVFTKPGGYSLVISGTINQTTFNNFVIPPAHEVPAIDTIMWPQAASNEARIAQLEDDIEELKQNNDGSAKGNAPGVEAAVLVTFIAMAVLVLRRRV